MARGRGKKPKTYFVMMRWSLLNSRAYQELPRSAAKALPFFIGKVKIPCGNAQFFETPFFFSYREAKRYLRFGTSTFAKVIRDLVKFGFIDPFDKGGLRGDGYSKNEFKNSRRWEAYGTPEFKEKSWEQFPPRR